MKIPAGPSLKLMLVLGALFTLSPAAAAAQSVSGRLLDAESGQPIPTAAILLLRGDSIVRTTTTNGEGVFVVTAPEPGSYRIRSEHIAYQPATSESMAIGANERVILDLRLSVAAIALEAVTVVVAPERRPGELRGFYDRQNRSPSGTFITKEWIERFAPTRASDILVFGGALRVTTTQEGDQRFSSGLRQPCMDVYVDGMRLPPSGLNVDDLVAPGFVEGVEIYKDAFAIPVPFGRSWSTCGAILIWTDYSR